MNRRNFLKFGTLIVGATPFVSLPEIPVIAAPPEESHPRYDGFPVLDAKGRPLSGGKVYIYAEHSNEPIALYKDPARTTALANPIVFDSTGRMPKFYHDTDRYKVVIRDRFNEIVFIFDELD